jgi:hypothetical protein
VTINFSSFPNLTSDNHRLTSQPANGENCIAHAVGARGEWWEPTIGRFWPLGPPHFNQRIESLVRVFERLGYAPCDSPEREPGYEKIAIYGDEGRYTHAARQLTEDGTWTSKLGPEDDINHRTLDALAGGEYGIVVAILRRPTSNQERSTCCEGESPAARPPTSAPPGSP